MRWSAWPKWRLRTKTWNAWRSLSRELYLSEQELDYLRRTNDFRNRLAAETNSQAIADARSDMQLYEGLQQVNKDRLLADDELDKFYTVLSREKRIRDARSEDEVEAALADIEKTGLLREEDVDNLRIDVAERRYRRGEAIKLMQLRDQIEFEKVRTAGEGQIAVEQMRQGLELQELTLAHRKREDEYSDERRARERELQRQTASRRWNWTMPRWMPRSNACARSRSSTARTRRWIWITSARWSA